MELAFPANQTKKKKNNKSNGIIHHDIPFVHERQTEFVLIELIFV